MTRRPPRCAGSRSRRSCDSAIGHCWLTRGADALYVALAEQLEAPLITCDKRLANSNGHKARIELYPVST